MPTMKAVVLQHNGERKDVEVEQPNRSDHDLLVRVHAVSVNPVGV